MAIQQLPSEGEIFEAQGRLYKRQGNYLLGVVGDQRGTTGQFVSIDPTQAAQQLGVQGFKSYNIGDIIDPLALQLGGGQASTATKAAVTAGQISLSQAKGGFDIGRATLSPSQGLAGAGIDTSKQPQQQFQAASQPQRQLNIVVPHPSAPYGWGIDTTTGKFAPLLPSRQRELANQVSASQYPERQASAPQFQSQQTQQQGIVPDERAPQGWGIDLSTGRFAPLPGIQKTTSQPLTQQTVSQDRLLGPTEYSALVKQLGVGPANFDQYFTRKGGDIYLKGTQTTGEGQQQAQSGRLDYVHPDGRRASFDARNTEFKEQLEAEGYRQEGQQQAQDTSTQGPDFKAAIEPKEEDTFTKLKDYLGLSDLQKQQTGFENKLVEAQKNLKTRYDTLQSELKARGLDDISKKIGDISRDALTQEQALRNLPEAKKQEVAPFKVTAAQLERLTAIDRSKIAQGLSDLVRLQSTYEGQYQRAYQQAKDAAEAGVEGAENALKAIGLQVKFATDKREKAEEALKNYAKTLTDNKKLRGEVQDVITYSQAVKSGYMDISEVPADVRGHVLTEIARPGTYTTAEYNISAIAEGTGKPPTTDRPLTTQEQNTLKVPSGVSTKSVYGIFGARKKEKAGGPPPVLPKGFDDDIRRSQDLIDGGRSDWGQEWNALRLRYPNVTADKIDTALGSARRIAGYYEDLERKQAAAKGEGKDDKFNVEQKTLTDIGTLQAVGKTTRSEVEQAIRLKGFDPTKEPWSGLVGGFPKKIKVSTSGRTLFQRLFPGGK